MNVLFLISHDISLRFGCYGDNTAVTPNIDKLASESLVFENHFCQYALCAPSRANIFTGCRPDTIGRYDIGTSNWYSGFRKGNRWLRTLPEHLKNNGWNARSLHKPYHECEKDPPSWSGDPWYAPWEPSQQWMPDNFECLDRATRYRDSESWEVMRRRFEDVTAKDPAAAVRFKSWRGPAVESAEVSDIAYPAGKVADEVCNALRNPQGRKPVFLAAGFAVTHMPWLSPRRYWDAIPEESVSLPENGGLIEGIPDKYRILGNEPYQYHKQNYHESGATLGWNPGESGAKRDDKGILCGDQLSRCPDRADSAASG